VGAQLQTLANQGPNYIAVAQASLSALAICVSAAVAIFIQNRQRRMTQRDNREMALGLAENLVGILEVAARDADVDLEIGVADFPEVYLDSCEKDLDRISVQPFGSPVFFEQVLSARSLAFVVARQLRHPANRRDRNEILSSAVGRGWATYNKLAAAGKLRPITRDEMISGLRESNSGSRFAMLLQ
jgi:hypothetical protein